MRVPVFTAYLISILVCLSCGYIYGVQTTKHDKQPVADRSIVCDKMAGMSGTRLQMLNNISDALFDDIVGVVYANCIVMEKPE